MKKRVNMRMKNVFVNMMKNNIGQRAIILTLFLLYLILGILIYRDYGISTDEPTERESTFTNIKYAMETLGYEGLNGVNGDLENYSYKYYGIAMQVPPALVEWAKDFPGGAAIFYYRHIWTFLVCFAGYICFYLMCREVFKSKWLSLLGTAMIALYPRFFAEQFYNIKDLVFVSMVMVSMFVTVRVIESNYSVFWTLLFAIVTALTTNVRIVGAIFPVLLIGYIWLIKILNKCGIETGEESKAVLRTSILTIVGYVLAYIAFMPILWKNPVQGILSVFTKFSDYDDWNGAVVFMGKIISGDEIPWYYVPVWMLVSLPVWYIVLFILITGALLFVVFQKLRKNEKLHFSMLIRNKYMVWAALIGFLPWFATVVAHSTLYNGWRHCYFVLPTLIFLILGGLKYFQPYLNKNKVARGGIILLSAGGLFLQMGWILKNHPYEMVYFNAVGRNWASDFDRDYWHLSMVELCRYILAHDESEKITLQAPNDIFMRFLSDEEKERISLEENSMYYIETYRGKTGNDSVMEGYEDYYSITIDGYRIATIFKRIV